MEKDEALLLLAACIPLADRLAAGEVRQTTQLTAEDRAVLAGFGRVKRGGWLDNLDTYQQAGLQYIDIVSLQHLITLLEGKENGGGRSARIELINYWAEARLADLAAKNLAGKPSAEID